MLLWRMLVVSLALVSASAQAEPLRLDAQGLDRVTGAISMPQRELVIDGPFPSPMPALGPIPWFGMPVDEPGVFYFQVCPPRCGQPGIAFPFTLQGPWLRF